MTSADAATSADASTWSDDRIRTFHGRHGRTTERGRRVLEALGPEHGLDRRPDATRPLVVEVGCGSGDAALAFCAAAPDVDLLAIDVHVPGVVRLLETRSTGAFPNLFVERGDALEVLDHRLGTASLIGLHLFFPDPWPKARHHKRRFVRPDILDLVADRLAPRGVFRMATDAADYVEWAVAHLDAHPAFEGGVTGRPAWRPVTRYESAGLDEGRRPTDLTYLRTRAQTRAGIRRRGPRP